MTGLILATLLNLAPGIQLADTVSGRNVALSEARLRFVSDEVRPGLDAMSGEQLVNELRRLDDSRPSLVGPIVMLCVGAALAVPGAFFGVFGFSLVAAEMGIKAGAGTAVGYLLLMGGGVFVIVAAVLLIIGVVKLIKRIGARRAHGEEVDGIQQRLDRLGQQQAPVLSPAPQALPPPPPQANLLIPTHLTLLATF